MYRSRLGKDLDDITLSYVSSIKDDSDIAFYDIIGSEAHVIMLYEKKLLTKSEVKKILSALEDLKRGNISQPDFEPEDIHELIESLISTSSINSSSVIVVFISGSPICDNSSKIFTRSCLTSCVIELNP